MKQIQNKNICSVRRPAYTTGAFTLVELIVVITILAILGTIAFISLQGYSAQARDSKRVSDISNIKKSVELFSLNTGKYPLPDEYDTVTYSGENLWYQGTVGDGVLINLSRNLNEKPVDPTTGLEYTYSTTHSQTEYEVLGLYESDLMSFNSLMPFIALAKKGIVSSSNASTQDYPKIDGNYNGIYIKTSSFYIPTPSIINAELVSDDDLDENLLKSQMITGGDNLPGVSTGGLDMTLSVYTGTITSESTDEEKMELVEAIQTAYNGSQLASDTMYADILSRTSTGELVDFVDVVVLGRAEYSSTNTSVTLYSSCKEILDNDSSSSDGIYTIDPENNGTGFDVYCDMTTDGGGWTLVFGPLNPTIITTFSSLNGFTDFSYTSSSFTMNSNISTCNYEKFGATLTSIKGISHTEVLFDGLTWEGGGGGDVCEKSYSTSESDSDGISLPINLQTNSLNISDSMSYSLINNLTFGCVCSSTSYQRGWTTGGSIYVR